MPEKKRSFQAWRDKVAEKAFDKSADQTVALGLTLVKVLGGLALAAVIGAAAWIGLDLPKAIPHVVTVVFNFGGRPDNLEASSFGKVCAGRSSQSYGLRPVAELAAIDPPIAGEGAVTIDLSDVSIRNNSGGWFRSDSDAVHTQSYRSDLAPFSILPPCTGGSAPRNGLLKTNAEDVKLLSEGNELAATTHLLPANQKVISTGTSKIVEGVSYFEVEVPRDGIRSARNKITGWINAEYLTAQLDKNGNWKRAR